MTESNSLLNRDLPFNDLRIEIILHDAERNVRNLCYAMQLVHTDCAERGPDGDFTTLFSVGETFYTLIDAQMDTIQRLHEGLDLLHDVTLDKLRRSEEFRRRPMPREAFRSEEAYREYLDSFAKESGNA